MLSPKPIDILCPSCGNQRVWRDGIRYTRRGNIQRYICRACATRFSETTQNSSDVSEHVQKVHRQILNCETNIPYNHQVGVAQTTGMINLAEVKSRTEKRAAGATETKPTLAEIKGKLIEYAWWMKKRGLSKETIESRVRKLNRLLKLGCNLMDSEEVKATIAKQNWNVNTKANVCAIFTTFLTCLGLTWEPPIYKPNFQIPFLPTEAEIDQLIASTGKKMSALLQLLKETAIRIGEACKIRWIDLDPTQKVLRVQSQKNSKPRIFHVSDKLINMLNMIPRKSEYIFNSNPRVLQSYFLTLRKRLAQRLSNPRLKEIHFHTLRHWKATTLYHQTKDILYVKEFLGHKRLDATLVYINIEKALFNEGSPEEFHVKIAQAPEEIKGLLEVGFEYVCQKDGLMFFKKRK